MSYGSQSDSDEDYSRSLASDDEDDDDESHHSSAAGEEENSDAIDEKSNGDDDNDNQLAKDKEWLDVFIQEKLKK